MVWRTTAGGHLPGKAGVGCEVLPAFQPASLSARYARVAGYRKAHGRSMTKLRERNIVIPHFAALSVANEDHSSIVLTNQSLGSVTRVSHSGGRHDRRATSLSNSEFVVSVPLARLRSDLLMILLARPRSFELLTFAFGGQYSNIPMFREIPIDPMRISAVAWVRSLYCEPSGEARVATPRAIPPKRSAWSVF
jgi:hypothetical protein